MIQAVGAANTAYDGLRYWLPLVSAALLFAGAYAWIKDLKTNHLHHLQLSMDALAKGQEKALEASERQKDAIVQAILTLK